MFKLAVLSFLVAFALAKNTYFDGMSDETVKGMLGTRMDGGHFSRDHGHVEAVDANLPAQFDSAVNWPHCKSTINYIKDQAACGSCWAVAASSVIADRSCIACPGLCPASKEGNVFLNEQLPCIDVSAEQIMGCCSWCGDGCQGGYPIDAMRYYSYTGVVSGGPYGSRCGCQPYLVSPTDRTEHPTPQCTKQCESGFPRSFDQDKSYGKDHFTIANRVEALQTEIQKNGPIECAFSVYKNFYKYPKTVPGIAHQIYMDPADSEYLGGHAVKMVGWGTDSASGTPYWIMHNSWNTTWGLNGQFKIQRGKNTCGIEAQCVAAIPKCNKDATLPLKCLN